MRNRSATEIGAARLTCERMRGIIERHRWRLRPITASFGIATIEPSTVTAAQLIEEADQALYHSKRCGRDRVTHYVDLIAAAV